VGYGVSGIHCIPSIAFYEKLIRSVVLTDPRINQRKFEDVSVLNQNTFSKQVEAGSGKHSSGMKGISQGLKTHVVNSNASAANVKTSFPENEFHCANDEKITEALPIK
jgi:hypothetical protein